MIKMVVFDMAGTTVNEHNVVYKTLHKAIQNAGFNVSYEQVLAEGAGKEKLQAIQNIMAKFYPDATAAVISAIFEQFKTLLNNAYQTLQVTPHHGAEEVFEWLKKHQILVVLNTGYSQPIAQLLLQKLGWKQGTHYDALITASEVTNGRPMPDMINLAKAQFDLENAAHIAKIGDSAVDIEEGINAGCGLTIGITTGAHTKEQLLQANPHTVIDSLLQLPQLLQ
ncbi:phosphonatase-like hydrolase [Sphingobacteriales bacterium UPWRP_1]|nr:HAD family hydrolase [Sphingobacteriales bacterium TSM_CSS]PSJ73355.1 phosphonatase-like hydrolase [Sphingobacteriales bacterium UPWRP_1]